jgi:hypothetical protein
VAIEDRADRVRVAQRACEQPGIASTAVSQPPVIEAAIARNAP